jgi:hypothetical protein
MTGAALVLAAIGAACSASGPDLPAGWKTANAVQHLSQGACAGSGEDPAAPPEALEVTSSAPLAVVYHHARFRCQQAVEGFVRTGPDHIDFLVQPVEMNPQTVARCDCLYDIELGGETAPDVKMVAVYHRWDHVGNPVSDPTLVGMLTLAGR